MASEAAIAAVNRLGIRPGLRRGDFKRVAQGGFGDGLNAYAHSMAWFNGHLYVGTTRGNFPFMKARLPIGTANPCARNSRFARSTSRPEDSNTSGWFCCNAGSHSGDCRF